MQVSSAAETLCRDFSKKQRCRVASDVVANVIWTPYQSAQQALHYYFPFLRAKAIVLERQPHHGLTLERTKFATGILGRYNGVTQLDDHDSGVIILDELADAFVQPIVRMLVPIFFNKNGQARSNAIEIMSYFHYNREIKFLLADFLIDTLTNYQIRGTRYHTSALPTECWAEVCRDTIAYIFLHEFGHILNRHFESAKGPADQPDEWADERGDIKKYMEGRGLEFDEAKVLKIVRSHELEMLADRFATQMILSERKQAAETIFALILFHHSRSVMQMVFASIYHKAPVVIPSLFDFYFFDGIANGESHPRSQVRVLGVRGFIEDEYGTQLGQQAKIIDDCLWEIFRDVYACIVESVNDWSEVRVHPNWQMSIGDYFSPIQD